MTNLRELMYQLARLVWHMFWLLAWRLVARPLLKLTLWIWIAMLRVRLRVRLGWIRYRDARRARLTLKLERLRSELAVMESRRAALAKILGKD